MKVRKNQVSKGNTTRLKISTALYLEPKGAAAILIKSLTKKEAQLKSDIVSFTPYIVIGSLTSDYSMEQSDVE